MKSYTFSVSNEEPSPDEADAVQGSLAAYNIGQTGYESYQFVKILLRDEEGKIVGSLFGHIYWEWLAIDILWLAEEVRGQNWGSRLLAEAEGMAMDAGCLGAHLDTMSFQAPVFYERHGYTTFGILEDQPPGHQRHFMQKRFGAGES